MLLMDFLTVLSAILSSLLFYSTFPMNLLKCDELKKCCWKCSRTLFQLLFFLHVRDFFSCLNWKIIMNLRDDFIFASNRSQFQWHFAMSIKCKKMQSTKLGELQNWFVLIFFLSWHFLSCFCLNIIIIYFFL